VEGDSESWKTSIRPSGENANQYASEGTCNVLVRSDRTSTIVNGPPVPSGPTSTRRESGDHANG
jgi:hypothetical protein